MIRDDVYDYDDNVMTLIHIDLEKILQEKIFLSFFRSIDFCHGVRLACKYLRSIEQFYSYFLLYICIFLIIVSNLFIFLLVFLFSRII